MAVKEIYICDRCGKEYQLFYYKPDGTLEFLKSKHERLNTFQLQQLRDYNCDFCYLTIDLCDKCYKELADWFFEEGKKN